MKKNYSITMISKACGISSQNLRAWETRYQAFTPTRDKNDNRVYSQNDYKRAILLTNLISNGFRISNIASKNLRELEGLFNQNELKDNKSKELKSIIRLLEDYQIDKIIYELNMARVNLSINEYIMLFILPLITKVGDLVALKKLTISQEHLVSSLIKDQLSQIQIPFLPNSKNQMVFATPEGNIHELSIQIAALIARSNQVRSVFLGAAHPAACLAAAMNHLESKELVLGAISSNQWDFKKEIIPYLNNLDKSLEKKIVIYIGGADKIKLPKYKSIKEIIFLKSYNEFNLLTRKA